MASFDLAPTLIQRLNAIEKPVTAQQLAGLLGVSAILVYKMAAKGAMPSFRLNSAVRFDTRAVARFLQGVARG